MTREGVIAAWVGGICLLVAAIVKALFDLRMKRFDIDSQFRSQVAADNKDCREQLRIAEAEADKWRGQYWELYEKHLKDFGSVIGNPSEVDRQIHALEVYRKAYDDPSAANAQWHDSHKQIEGEAKTSTEGKDKTP